MNFKNRNKVSPEFSMSSMTDIVFLLLIFFMLTSNAPNALDMILPKAKGKSTNTQNVSVSIKKNLTYYVNGKKLKANQIEGKLKSLLSNNEKPTLMLRAEEGVPIEKAVLVMDIANRNKYKVILAVRPK
ncbi:MAG TPA: biopolymer transporter ExbD [Lutibacter sp.]|nr:biopolymer transporter ExbD [Lutibacter sp.]